MKIAFHGAARTVTGSKHLISLKSGKRILLDCGMFQGLGKQTDDLNREWGFEPSSVNYLILSHAHIDHSGLIPKLVKDGFNGKIYCTPATRDLATILLEDSAGIQQTESNNQQKNGNNHNNRNNDVYCPEPLFLLEDVMATIPLFQEVEYDLWYKIDEETEVMFTDAGHLIGSAAVHLKVHEDGELKTITFTGDIGRYRNVILNPPKEFHQSDYVIIESTYGDSLHDLSLGTPDKLLHHIKNTCINKRGKLIIPAFSVGRTQELLFALNQLELEHRLPELNYYVDSPLAVKATDVVKRYPRYFKESVKKILEMDSDPFLFKGLKYTVSSEESQQLSQSDDPCVIIAASGMAEAGRIRHHIRQNIEIISNTILIVGYCDPESLGGQLLAGKDGVYIMGDAYQVKADVASIQSLSAHGDYNDLLNFLSCQDAEQVKRVFLVHGEFSVQQQFMQRLHTKGFKQVEIPEMHEEIDLDVAPSRKRIPVDPDDEEYRKTPVSMTGE
jgi:metallo-beta-lactamase family protein